jgi:formylglycine-generating enzyme required for sulfatase activity
MPPEQAKGQIHLLDARADVYALGAMLYELLAGWPPYDDLDWGGDPQRLVLLVSHMPPTPLAQAAPSAAPELVAICEKAMAREREERYDDMGGMARDLRAWSEGRVVTAYEQGALAELRKWVGRNRGWAVSIVAGVLALLGGVSGMLVVEARGKRQVETERDVTELTSAPQIGRGLMREVDELWPALPALVDRYELWLAQAQALKAQEGFLREGLAALRGEAAGTPFERAQLDAKLQPNLEELLGRWDELAASERRIRARLDFAQGLEGRTRTGAEAQALWARAAADIAQLPPYGGLELEAQLGLLPLRRDPRSGLWEFWHVASGARPELHATGDRWSLEPETGLVLVLIPGGEATVGSVPYAQDDSNSGQPYVDRWHAPAEGPQRQVALDPFFLSKYELTRGQWARSQERAADADGTLPATELSFDASEEAVRRLGLSLPTDPQWEYACRAGTTEPWSFEILGESSTHANGLDVSRLAALGYGAEYIEGFKANWGDYDDGFPELAPAGALLPNPWGLHEIHGNAWEFAREPFTEALGPFDPGEGIQASPSENGLRTLRGGSLGGELSDARSSYRHPYSRKYMDGDTGVRPSRGLVR